VLANPPVRVGYTFMGWYADATGNEPFDFEIIIDGAMDINVYANWEPNETRTITFDLAGGNIGDITTNPTRQVRDGQSISNSTVVPIDNTIPRNPERLGFIFDGWYMADTPFTDAIVISGGDITVIARWIPDPSFLNVSIPTSVMFQSNHINHQNLESANFEISNNSSMGLHVYVNNFTATSTTQNTEINNLFVREQGSTSSIGLINSGSISNIGSNQLLMAIPGGLNRYFNFHGNTNGTREVINPSFDLTLEFEVVSLP